MSIYDDLEKIDFESSEELLKIILPTLEEIVMAGLAEGLLPIIDVVGLGIDWRLINDAALDFAESYSYELVTGITGTTRNFLQTELAEWIASGEHKQDLINRIDASGYFGPTRAHWIATTETTRAYSEANLLGWRDSGVVSGKRWMTGEDEVVCPICGMLANEEVGLNELFPGGLDGPPAHVECRCYIRPVVDSKAEETRYEDAEFNDMVDHYWDWEGSLREEEVDAIQSYTSSGYHALNEDLRTGKPLDSKLTKLHDNLVNTIDKSPGLPQDTNLYRRFRHQDLVDAAQSGALKVGDTIQETQFLSTSILSAYGEAYGTGGVAYHIHAPKGMKAAFLGFQEMNNYWESEQEVLLPPGIKFIIKAMNINEWGRLILNLGIAGG